MEATTTSEFDPRSVLRGSKLQSGFLGLDSLYLIVEYPYRDLFDYWSAGVGDLQDKQLYEGVVYEGKVLRRGGSGYKLSVWDGDARLFLTDQVTETLLAKGLSDKGMGVMLQLGPKWLITSADLKDADDFRAAISRQLAAFGLHDATEYPARLNRLDIALDVVGLDTAGLSILEWHQNWIGYAKPRHIHFSASTGKLEGLSIGSYYGAVRFKFYDKFQQSLHDQDLPFWLSVWDLSLENFQPITRFEWSLKPYQAKFSKLQYLTDYSFEGLVELLNYASLKWGRLCLPNTADENTSRLKLAPLWTDLRGMIENWAEHYAGIAKRQYDLNPEISQAYLTSLAGWLAGLQARVGVQTGDQAAVNLDAALAYLLQHGISEKDLQDKADIKHEVMQILLGLQRGQTA